MHCSSLGLLLLSGQVQQVDLTLSREIELFLCCSDNFSASLDAVVYLFLTLLIDVFSGDSENSAGR